MFNFSSHNETLDITCQCVKDGIIKSIEEFLSLFYIIFPTDSIKEDPYDVPDYEVTLLMAVGSLVIIEQIFRYFQRQDLSRIQDFVINIGSAGMFILLRVFLLTTMIMIFVWLHKHMRIIDLPLHSVWTWLFSLLLVEFTYYWTHRALHEFNILWAAHQFHHMAEDINITTTIRDSMVDMIIYAFFPLPLAMIIPPPILMVHVQFSLIYQVWLHNDVIGHLGFIEHIINTPRQHRVHHGKNPYCIDKNYGALLMIWDRMFGTYQTEKEKIIFGVVSPTPQTYDSMTLQFGYYRDVWEKFNKVEGSGNKLSAIFKGPGWSPGKQRLGDIRDIPKPDKALPKYSHDPFIPTWKKAYIGLHAFIGILGFYILADHQYMRNSPGRGLVAMFYIIFALTAFGAIFDNRKWAPIIEISRCLVYFPFDYFLIESVNWQLGPMQDLMYCVLMWSIRAYHALSILFWIYYCFACKNSVVDTRYRMVAKAENDIQSKTSDMRRFIAYKTIFLTLGFLLMTVPFGIAWSLRLHSCTQMYNNWYYVISK